MRPPIRLRHAIRRVVGLMRRLALVATPCLRPGHPSVGSGNSPQSGYSMRQLQLCAQEIGNPNLRSALTSSGRAPAKPMTDAGERNEPVTDTGFGKASGKPGGFRMRHVSVGPRHARAPVGGNPGATLRHRTIAIEPRVIPARVVRSHFLQPPTLLPAIQVEAGSIDTNSGDPAPAVHQAKCPLPHASPGPSADNARSGPLPTER